MKLSVEEIKENEDGTTNIVFDYDDEFLEAVKKQLKNDSPTDEEINMYIMQILAYRINEINKEKAEQSEEAEGQEKEEG